jgi:hypothetical protein
VGEDWDGDGGGERCLLLMGMAGLGGDSNGTATGGQVLEVASWHYYLLAPPLGGDVQRVWWWWR